MEVSDSSDKKSTVQSNFDFLKFLVNHGLFKPRIMKMKLDFDFDHQKLRKMRLLAKEATMRKLEISLSYGKTCSNAQLCTPITSSSSNQFLWLKAQIEDLIKHSNFILWKFPQKMHGLKDMKPWKSWFKVVKFPTLRKILSLFDNFETLTLWSF